MRRHTRVPIGTPLAALFCSEHPDEELSYYCLDCEGNCICAECAIRGRHKEHDVQPIRRAYSEIVKRVKEVVGNLEARRDVVNTILARIESHKREIGENTRSIKESMALSFNEVREKLKKKEAEFVSAADKFQED